jgi:hypothetical protein
LLPDVNQFNGEAQGPIPDSSKDVSRLREIAVQKMVEGSAKTRINNALRSKTQAPAQLLSLQTGDLVDFYRPPTRKDDPGWIGPAKVVNISEAERGHVDVKWQGRIYSVKHPCVRRHNVFLCCLSAQPATSYAEAEQIVGDRFMSMLPDTTLLLGQAFSKGRWHNTRETVKNESLFRALNWLSETKYQLGHCPTIRMFKSTAALQAMPNYLNCTLVWWRPKQEDQFDVYHFDPRLRLSIKRLFPDFWSELCGLQFLYDQQIDDDECNPDEEPDTDGKAEEHELTSNSFKDCESISEIEIADDDSFATAESYFLHDQMDPELLKACQTATAAVFADADEKCDACDDKFEDLLPLCCSKTTDDVVINYQYYAANQRAGLPASCGLPTRSDYVDVEYPAENAYLLDLPRKPESGEIAILRIYLAAGAKKAVIERDTDLLTNEELAAHKEEVKAAILAELATWAKYECFSPKKRSVARNIIDSRFVFKWKYETINGKSRRVIRARLCVRGFKDKDKATLDTYAGTSKRYSQRIVASTAARYNWPIVTADISKAFLQGVTYEELSKLTGEPLREVNFTLPPGLDTLECLRKLPGFEKFDPRMEVLHNDKPGTGSVDAPRAFSLKLAQVTQNVLDMQPTTTDEELVLKHNRQTGALEAVMSKHVDDLKITGSKETIAEIISELEKVFGSIKLEWHTFTNCGVRHVQDPTTNEVTLDQNEYIAALKPIATEGIRSRNPEEPLDEVHESLFRSLLGAAAFALLTRVDVAVFVVALQRSTTRATWLHIKRLNVVVRYMQKHPRSLKYGRLSSEVCLFCS